MIDQPGQELDRPHVPGVPDDIAYLGATIADLSHWMHKVYDALRRQESPNPTIIRLDPGVIVQTTARMRAMFLCFTGGTTTEVMALKVGAANMVQWVNQASDVPLPLPIVIDAGVDLQVVDLTTPAAVNWRCYMTAYVELEDGNA